jgi:tripartite-type tricarboxylate transporter receptor subunit TctC
MFNSMPVVLPLVKSGKLKGLAVGSAQRSPAIPELPTVAEAGVPGFDVSSWIGLFVPAKTPVQIVSRLNADTVAALADPATRQKLEAMGVVVVASAPGALADAVKADMAKWGPIIKEAGISIRD